MKITQGAVVKGGSSLNYKTGTWRDQRPVINYEICRNCGICQEVCPDDAVKLENETYRIEYEYCKGCGICAHECTAHAVLMIPEEK